MSKYIALDVGERRVGVAKTDDLGIIASPYLTLDRDKSVEEVIKLIEVERPLALVVGMPYLPSGGLGSQSSDVRMFVEELQKHIKIPINFENEVLTSVEAENRLRSMTKGRPEKGDIDAMAACIILESFLTKG